MKQTLDEAITLVSELSDYENLQVAYACLLYINRSNPNFIVYPNTEKDGHGLIMAEVQKEFITLTTDYLSDKDNAERITYYNIKQITMNDRGET